MSEEVDLQSLSDEDLDTNLENQYNEAPEEETPEADEVETNVETSEDDVDSDSTDLEAAPDEDGQTTDEVAPDEDGQTAEEKEETEKLYAGTFRTIEDLEVAYKKSNAEGLRLAQERAELLKNQKQEELAAEKSTQQTPENNEFFDKDEYNRIYYEESPAEANIYMMSKWSESQQSEAQQTKVQMLEQESKNFNDNLSRDRAKELLYERANELGDRSLMDKYKDPNYVVTTDDLNAFPAVLENFLTESEFIQNYFQKTPIKDGDNIISGNGRWPKDAYKRAHILLNHDKIVEQKVLETSENVGQSIKNAAPKAKVITASGSTNTDIKVRFSANDSRDTVAEKARKISDAELDQMLEEQNKPG